MIPTCIDPSEFTHWALPIDALDWLNRFIKKQGIRSVIEAGSGLSTIWLASLMQDGILERSLSLEHDPSWYDYTHLKLEEKGLLQHADMRLCPLKQQAICGQLTKWYSIEAIGNDCLQRKTQYVRQLDQHGDYPSALAPPGKSNLCEGYNQNL